MQAKCGLCIGRHVQTEALMCTRTSRRRMCLFALRARGGLWLGTSAELAGVQTKRDELAGFAICTPGSAADGDEECLANHLLEVAKKACSARGGHTPISGALYDDARWACGEQQGRGMGTGKGTADVWMDAWMRGWQRKKADYLLQLLWLLCRVRRRPAWRPGRHQHARTHARTHTRHTHNGAGREPHLVPRRGVQADGPRSRTPQASARRWRP